MNIPGMARYCICLLLALLASLAAAQSWVTPSLCADDGVTGNEEDDPPIVNFYEGPSPGNWTTIDVVNSVTFNKGVGYAQVTINNAFNSFFLTVSYTPFLSGYAVPTISSFGTQWTFQLPAAGTSSNPAVKLYSSVQFTVKNPNDSNKVMPYANVMFMPDYPGSSPYDIQADGNGQFTVYCFQALPAGEPVYVVSQDGSVSFDDTYTVKPNDVAATSTATHERQQLSGIGGSISVPGQPGKDNP